MGYISWLRPTPTKTANPGLFLSSNLLKRASTSALARVLYYLPILEEDLLEKLKTSTRQVEGVTIVDLSGRITLAKRALWCVTSSTTSWAKVIKKSC